MKRITNPKELQGKTIKKAILKDWSDSILILFTDNTYIYLGVNWYGDSYIFDLTAEMSHGEMYKSGIINKSEFKQIKHLEEIRHKEQIEEKEWNEFNRLKNKYEG